MDRSSYINYAYIKLLIFIPVLLSTSLFAQNQSKKADIKGIDFKLGPTHLDLSGNDACEIFSAVVLPDIEKNGLPIKGFENGEFSNFCTSIYLGLVSSNQKFKKSKLLKYSENRFGVNFAKFNQRFGMINCDVLFSNDTTNILLNDGQINYSGYGIHADYTINSRPFFNNFATYLSFGTSIVLHNFKAVGQAGSWFRYAEPTIGGIEMTNTKTTLTSVDLKAFLGVKYNFTCDLNLFIECGFGGSYYHRGLYGKSKLIKAANITFLGMRYKFVKDEDRSKSKSGVFW